MLSKSELRAKKAKKSLVRKGEENQISQLEKEVLTLNEQNKMLKEMLKSSQIQVKSKEIDNKTLRYKIQHIHNSPQVSARSQMGVISP